MSQFKENSFADRRKAAVTAKLQLQKKFDAAPKADDPETIAKRLEREAIAAARDARQAERDRVKQEQRDMQLAEAAKLREAEEAAKTKQESEAKDRIARVISDEATRKEERDRRYAARKARNG